MSVPADRAFDCMTVVGNRPQFVKMGPVSAELRSRGHREFIVHTGQHFDENMSGVFFEELGLPRPDLHLHVQGRRHGQMTAEMLGRLEEVMLEQRPPWVLVYGDTNSTLAAALAAVKLQIPLAHVEAGPRIYDIDTPEEINRIVADNAARLRFCPDLPSVQNLAKENLTQGVYFTGDVMYDAFLICSRRAEERSTILDRLQLRQAAFVLLTVHRPNNTDSPEALGRLVELLRGSPMAVVFPVHPRTEAALKRVGLWDTLNALPQVQAIPAVGYLDMLALTNAAQIVFTDSGGLQKEAFFARKPVVVLFYVSPWPQIVESGWLKLCWKDDGIDPDGAIELMHTFRPSGYPGPIFGDGHAAVRIVDVLEQRGWLRQRCAATLPLAG
jgi:UDP-N-acetylglucosamine 2-epimerase